MKVAIVGASGETGSSIVNGLLESAETKFEITALTRPSSLEKAANVELAKRGVKLVAAVDFADPDAEARLVELLGGIDVVLVAVDPRNFAIQIPLANAAKKAGVKRFVPCTFATVCPPKGVMKLRDDKEDIINHIKKIRLPYTIIDVGWWFQLSVPSLPSGRADRAISIPIDLAGDGNVPSALTDNRDIGRYVARILADERTLNRMVFVYGQVLSQNQVIDLMERVSGESIKRDYLPESAILASIKEAQASSDAMAMVKLYMMQYLHSWGIRGDNTPENARYLGYLNGKELYPDLETIPLKVFFQEVLDGKVKAAYK